MVCDNLRGRPTRLFRKMVQRSLGNVSEANPNVRFGSEVVVPHPQDTVYIGDSVHVYGADHSPGGAA